MSLKNKVIAFDCDGTIVDTFLLIEKTVLLTFQEIFPEYPLTIEEARSFFGPFLNDSFRKYVTTEEEVNYCVERYRYYNNLLMPEYIKPYDGIKELLKWLKQKGIKIAIVSNKVTEAIVYGLKLCQIEPYFDLIIGAEKLKEPKPNPDGLYQLQEYYHPDQMMFVGDTTIDIETGNNAKISTIGVTWCKSTKQQLLDAGATHVVDHPEEIKQIVREYYGV